jgi:hypothetical protein
MFSMHPGTIICKDCSCVNIQETDLAISHMVLGVLESVVHQWPRFVLIASKANVWESRWWAWYIATKWTIYGTLNLWHFKLTLYQSCHLPRVTSHFLLKIDFFQGTIVCVKSIEFGSWSCRVSYRWKLIARLRRRMCINGQHLCTSLRLLSSPKLSGFCLQHLFTRFACIS